MNLNVLEKTDLLVGGRWRSPGRGRFDDTAPRDGEVFATAPNGDVADMRAAIGAAREAFDDGPWARATHGERARVLRQLADALARHAPFFDKLARLEWGMANDQPSQIAAASLSTTMFAELAVQLDEEVRRGPDAVGAMMHTPHGVVAAVTPWNYPHVLNLGKVAPAIAAGNSVVLKPSP